MSKYAQSTEVPRSRSLAEIERIIEKYHGTAFAYGWQGDRAMVGFSLHDRQVRFTLPMPERDSPEFTRTETGRTRSASAAFSAWEQAGRQRWRALALVIKAKMEAVETGIVTFEEEFAPHIVLPDGRTVAEHIIPAIEQAYTTGQVPPMLALDQ